MARQPRFDPRPALYLGEISEIYFGNKRIHTIWLSLLLITYLCWFEINQLRRKYCGNYDIKYNIWRTLREILIFYIRIFICVIWSIKTTKRCINSTKNSISIKSYIKYNYVVNFIWHESIVFFFLASHFSSLFSHMAGVYFEQ